jgi:hypothetical protein
MKKLNKILFAIAVSALFTGVVHAEDAPPSLDLSGFFNEEPPPQFNPEFEEENNNQNAGDEGAPPNVDFDGFFDGQDGGNGENPDVNNDDNGNNNNDGNVNTPNFSLRITDHQAVPSTFNPLTGETTISYDLSEDARVDVEIFNNDGQRVLYLLRNDAQDDGDNAIRWEGTTNGRSDGQIVARGNYSYKITAKDPASGIAAATATGNITVQYFANVDNDGSGFSASNDQNIVALNNTPPEVTSHTGPGVLVYAMCPLFAYFYNRRKFKK